MTSIKQRERDLGFFLEQTLFNFIFDSMIIKIEI